MDEADDAFEVPFRRVKLSHERLGYATEVCIPFRALHRPALRHNLEGQYYEPLSHLNFKRILDRKGNGSVIHAGAFYGDMLHTLSCSASVVHAFEPVLENFVLARVNAMRMGLGNVRLQNAALSDANTIVGIVTEQEDGRFAGGASTIADDDGRARELVPAFRIDDLPLNDICLIHLDIEGHEASALEGARRTIHRDRPVIMIEDNSGNCPPILSSLGYEHAFKRGGLSYWATETDIAFVKTLAR